MQHTAKGIASLGRNGDDTLLHVNKEELVGLQALLGPVTVNPETGLPEAFSWTDILTSLGIGILGAATGGAAAPALGAIGATAVGAGTGALAGGALSSMQGKGFMPGALGGAISGGMGAFGGTDLEGGATKAITTEGMTSPAEQAAIGEKLAQGTFNEPSIVVQQPQGAWGYGKQFANLTGAGGADLETPITAQYRMGVEPSALTRAMQQQPGVSIQTEPSYMDNLGKQWGAMTTKSGMEDLLKPIGLGAMLGSGATATSEAASASATQMRQEKLKQALADKQQRDYFASLGFPLPEEGAGTSWSPAAQRNYFGDLIYGAAAGGPIELSRSVAGVPVNTTIPPKYVSKFENADLNESLTPALQDIRQTSAQLGSRLGYANGGYINTQPMGAEPYPQSQIPRAQPYPAATPQRHEVVSVFAGGGSAYEKGGFLDGPGDGMSDDIPANIDGREEIRLADGEFVVPPEMVSLIGGGDPEEGKRLLDQLLPMVRQAAHGKKEQIKQDAGKLAAEKLLTRKAAKGDAGRSGIEAAH